MVPAVYYARLIWSDHFFIIPTRCSVLCWGIRTLSAFGLACGLERLGPCFHQVEVSSCISSSPLPLGVAFSA